MEEFILSVLTEQIECMLSKKERSRFHRCAGAGFSATAVPRGRRMRSSSQCEERLGIPCPKLSNDTYLAENR